MWVRLKESEAKAPLGMLPSRIVLERQEPDGNYRTFLETLVKGGPPRFSYGRFFDSEEAALEDFRKRVARL